MATKRLQLPKSHPVLAKLSIDAAEFHRFEQLNENHPETKIIRHDDPKSGMIGVFVACANDEVAVMLTDAWA
jgi:hypothetical protein